MQDKKIVIVTGVILLVALAVIWWEIKPPPTRFNRAPIIGIGQVLADETARAINDRGQIVVVVAGNPARPVMPGNGLWDGFRNELKKHAGISILATEFVDVARSGYPVCSTPRFKDIWERYGSADAIVCFVGVPDWFEVRNWFSPRATPKILAMDTDVPLQLRYRENFANGLLSVLIGLRGESESGTSAAPQTPREWFNRRYRVYTAQNYESLPD